MLPKILPLSKYVHLPILDKKVQVFAYNVGEYKNLLLNKNDSEDGLEDYLLSLIQAKCPEVDVKKLTMVDLTILFLQMTEISVGLAEDVEYRCSTQDEKGQPCNTVFKVNIDVTKYEIIGKVEKSKLIDVTDDIKIEVSYPYYVDISKLDPDDETYGINLLAKCIRSVYVGKDDVITDFSDKEIQEWVMDCPASVLDEFSEYVKDIPRLEYKYTVECPKCHTKAEYVNTNLLDFFTVSSQR